MTREHPTPWRQFDVQFADPATAESAAVAHLWPAFHTATDDGLIGPWFFIRKSPWRFRYLPADCAEPEVVRRLTAAATAMGESGEVTHWTENIYEPEQHAFGGAEATERAHLLFHADSRGIVAHVSAGAAVSVNRREISVMLCTAMMRGAGLESFERGDVWAKVSDGFRPPRDAPDPAQWQAFRKSVRRLTSADTRPGSTLRTGTLAFADEWLSAFEEFGRDLATLWRAGHLTAGFRAVIAHHVIFHWNRIGLDYTAQSRLALAAKQNVFNGVDEADQTRPARTTSRPRLTGPAPDPATDTFRGTSPTATKESPMTVTAAEDQAAKLRGSLVDKLIADGRITSPATEHAFRTVQRHRFAPEAELHEAYADDAVHTKTDDDGQLTSSISAPWLQALMIEQARLRPGSRVLEIGSGGYQAALLREIVGPEGAVTTMDIDADITARARQLLDAAGYDDVEVVTGDGEFGWDAGAPYDAVIVTVQAADIPAAWTDQIVPGGRLVVPLRLFGQNRTLAFTVAGPRMIADRSIFSGFVHMHGAGGFDTLRTTVRLHGTDVDLTFLGSTPQDPEALAGALDHGEPVQRWTGTGGSGHTGYVGELQMYLGTVAPGICSAPRDEALIPDGVMMFGPVSTLAGSFAYLASRKTGDDWELGAVAFGPQGEALAEKIASHITRWDREVRGGPGMVVTVLPASTPADEPPGFGVTVTRHRRITVTWPSWGEPTSDIGLKA